MRYLNANYFAWQARKKGKSLNGMSNPFYTTMLQLKDRAPTWDEFFEQSVEDIHEHWDELDSIWQPLRKQFAWSVPDPRALKILGEFSPLVEIGAGNGYWSALLQKRGVDVLSFDYEVRPKNCWSKVRRGGPEVLLDRAVRGRNLFLCYPDETESIAIFCLENFTGEYIIHVGELAMSGTVGGVPQAPYGRSSSAEFQVALQESFHCLLVAQLHITLPYAKDCISVWKRTNYVRGKVPSTDTCNTGCCSSQSCGAESESDIDDDSEDEEGDLEEDDGQDSEVDTDIAQGDGNSSMGSADAVTYMSIADLNKLRAGTDTNTNTAGGQKSSRAVSRIKVQDPNGTTKSSEAEAGSGDCTDHISYMSAAELKALREASSGTEEEEEEEKEEEEEEGHACGSKRDRDVRHSGYSYGDDEEEEEEEEEERVMERSRGRKRLRRQTEGEDEDGEGEGVEDDVLSEVRRLREEALDAQYEESDDKLWANIPKDEMLPVDRAAPCLQHLLDFHPTGGRQVMTY